MKSPFYFIVKAYNGKRYDNTKRIGDIDFIVSSSKEDHTVSNRYAIVQETPINYTGEIKPGDLLLVHHNVFKYYNDMKGREKSGKSFFKDDLFFIDFDQFYMYKRNNTWKCHDKYCMIKPIESYGVKMLSMGFFADTDQAIVWRGSRTVVGKGRLAPVVLSKGAILTEC